MMCDVRWANVRAFHRNLAALEFELLLLLSLNCRPAVISHLHPLQLCSALRLHPLRPSSFRPCNMSSSITRISARELSALLHPSASSSTTSATATTTPTPPSILIVDVRDDDHIGGHIAGSVHFPSTSLYRQLTQLQRRCVDKDLVVFHCMLSQQRGPAAAAQFAQHMAQQHAQNNTPMPRIAILEKGMTGWVSHLHGRHREGEDVRRLMEEYDAGTWGVSFKPVAATASTPAEAEVASGSGGGAS